jgi:hypothetical protein
VVPAAAPEKGGMAKRARRSDQTLIPLPRANSPERRFRFLLGGTRRSEPLRRVGGSVIVRGVKFFRALLLALALLSFTGCVGYTKFRSTNPRGETIAEWTGRGLFYPVSGGYRITAVERISGPPYMLESRYPNGRRVTVTGSHIERWHTHKPLWMYELEHPDYATANYSRREVPRYQVVRTRRTIETTRESRVQLLRRETGS